MLQALALPEAEPLADIEKGDDVDHERDLAAVVGGDGRDLVPIEGDRAHAEGIDLIQVDDLRLTLAALADLEVIKKVDASLRHVDAWESSVSAHKQMKTKLEAYFLHLETSKKSF